MPEAPNALNLDTATALTASRLDCACGFNVKDAQLEYIRAQSRIQAEHIERAKHFILAQIQSAVLGRKPHVMLRMPMPIYGSSIDESLSRIALTSIRELGFTVAELAHNPDDPMSVCVSTMIGKGMHFECEPWIKISGWAEDPAPEVTPEHQPN